MSPNKALHKNLTFTTPVMAWSEVVFAAHFFLLWYTKAHIGAGVLLSHLVFNEHSRVVRP